MSTGNPADLGVVEASGQLAGGTLSSVELTRACLDRIDGRDPALGAWLNVYADYRRLGGRGGRRRAGGVARPAP